VGSLDLISATIPTSEYNTEYKKTSSSASSAGDRHRYHCVHRPDHGRGSEAGDFFGGPQPRGKGVDVNGPVPVRSSDSPQVPPYC
jgi:hypothetical protein